MQRPQEGVPDRFGGHTVDVESLKAMKWGAGVSLLAGDGQSLPLRVAAFHAPAPQPPYFGGNDSLWPQVWREQPESRRAVFRPVLKVTAVATVNSARVDRITAAPETGRLRPHLESPVWIFQT